MRERAAVLVLAVATACAGGRAAAWNDKGLAAERSGNYAEALTDYAEAVKLDPGSARYHTNLGGILLRRNLLQQAGDEFRAALKIDPGYTDASRGLEFATMRQQLRQGQATADAIDGQKSAQ